MLGYIACSALGNPNAGAALEGPTKLASGPAFKAFGPDDLTLSFKTMVFFNALCFSIDVHATNIYFCQFHASDICHLLSFTRARANPRNSYKYT